jgi:hypothetical protein
MESIPFDCSFSLYSKYNYDNKLFDFCSLIYEIYNHKYSFDGELSQLHSILNRFSDSQKTELIKIPQIGVNDRKSIFIRDYYDFVDTDSRFQEQYKQFIITYIKPLFPNESLVLYQTTPNIRISFPQSTAIGFRSTDPSADIIGLHSDSEFGHSEHEMNFVIPITNMFYTNSIYFEKYIDSPDTFNDYENLLLKKNEFFRCYFNRLRHYNRINETGKTRISIDFRIIPYSKYNDSIANTSISSHKQLKLGEYFSLI